ncbi:MAG: hypothetical protein HKP58_12135, partial [Desulfatitalea sp.]|nr:DUF2162 domain-containing protein [Desulfatitalea sp.]NNK01150.1 hypothetical protein [Desulfatitalea sp.]
LVLYAMFMMINLLTILVLRLWKQYRNSSADSLLGGAMFFIAVYFLLSVSIMPQFADVDKVYRMAVYQSGSTAEPPRQLILFLSCMVILFAGGFSATALKARRTR